MTTNLDTYSSGQLDVYRQEVFDFLKTVTLKFDPFAYVIGQRYMAVRGTESYNDPEHPYIKQLCGLYTETDTPIVLWSPDEEKEVVLTRAYLESHPKTKSTYRIPTIEYTTLCKRYPAQSGLIRSIIYPAASPQDVIDAPVLGVLSYDASLLYSEERESLLSAMTAFLTMARERWWNAEYCYENLYATGFWYLLWQTLPSVLFAQRVLNIGTPAAHPFHIWETLQSHGLKDYRDILSQRQMLWLYRNIGWIVKNKGKHTTLIEIGTHLLDEIFADLGQMTIRPDTAGSTATCKPRPVIAVTDVIHGGDLEYISTADLLDKIESEGLTPPTDPLQRETLNDTLVTTEKNELRTKYFEFVKQTTNTQYENLVMEFLWDSLFYRFSQGDLGYSVLVTEPLSGATYKLDIRDAIALMYWSAHMQYDFPVTQLPKEVCTRICFKKQRVQYKDVKQEFPLCGQTYRLDDWIATQKHLDAIPYHSTAMTSHDQYIDLTTKQFAVLLQDYRDTSESGDARYQEAMSRLYGHLFVQQCIPLSFGPNISSFDDLRRVSPQLHSIMSLYDTVTDKVKYSTLCTSLISSVIPLTNEKLGSSVGISAYQDSRYDKFKELFIQLCSYNITFLDTTRQGYTYIVLPSMRFHDDAVTYYGGTFVNPVCTMDIRFKARYEEILRVRYAVSQQEVGDSHVYSEDTTIPSIVSLNLDNTVVSTPLYVQSNHLCRIEKE